jgi:hypothetical protein
MNSVRSAPLTTLSRAEGKWVVHETLKTANPKHEKYPMPIREWSEDGRPREKLLKYGEQIHDKRERWNKSA